MNPESRESQPERYEISEGEEKRVEYPDKVFTSAVFSCHALAILNTKKRIGYLGHFYNFTDSGESLLRQALDEADAPDELETAVVGNVPLSKEDVDIMGVDFNETLESYHEHSKWLLNLLAKNGVVKDKIQNALIDDPTEGSYEVEVDTESGKITIRKEDL
jgi:hypothetical protein